MKITAIEFYGPGLGITVSLPGPGTPVATFR